MTKLHELLAVESSVAGNYSRDKDETMKVLNRPAAFQRVQKDTSYFNEDEQKLNTQEVTDITTTVADRLKWFSGHAIKLYDVILQKDKTNQAAVADLEVNGTVIASNVPAVTLLSLESKLQDIRAVLEAAPTLPAGIPWRKDDSLNLFVTSDPTVSFRTKKTIKPIIMAPATDKHPAQVEKLSEDVPVAKITTTTWAGMLTSAQKADLLGRLDALQAATKMARQRANAAEVVKDNIGANIFKYIFGDTVA